MPFRNGASWLLVFLLAGSSLLPCSQSLICLANVLLLALCILSVHGSADVSLHIKRSRYGPLPWVLEVRRQILLIANWLLDDLEQLLFFLLPGFPLP